MNYYQRYYKMILTRGVTIAPRGMETRALFNQTVSFFPGQCWRREKDNPAIGVIEGLQFIAGTSDKEAIKAAAPSVNLDLFGPLSFYGPRTAGQFDRVVNDLKDDQTTRRAVLMVAHPDDTPGTLPCTLTIQFWRQDHNLNMLVNMRSSDAVWGLPYDMIQFGMVHLAVCRSLGEPVMPGTGIVHMANAHIYMDHQANSPWREWSFRMPMLGSWDRYVDWAKDLVAAKLNRAALLDLFSFQAARDERHANRMTNDSADL